MSFNESNTEGQIGEQLYIDYMNDNNIKFADVREDKLCQWLDIDFIILHNNHTKEDVLENIKNGNPSKRNIRQQNVGYAVEVKVDKVTHNRFTKKNGEIYEGTGNLVYEIISHNMPGCLARSYADFILYICIDTFENNTLLKKAYMINLYKWRKAMIDSGKDNTQNIQLKPLKYIQEKGKFEEEYVLNILHPVNKLLEIPNTITDFTTKLIKYFPKKLHITK
jgi:hypothetical protein